MSGNPAESRYGGRLLSLAGIEATGLADEDLVALFRKALGSGIHGLSFSTYLPGQAPGDHISEQQLRERLSIIASHVSWVRAFSCTDGNEAIGRIAHEFGLKTLVGAWIEGDGEKDAIEIDALIEVAKAGHADIVAVGNEVLLRDELSEDDLIERIEQVKAAVPDVPVGYVDAYYKFVDHPRVTAACDVVLANCYPFWEGCAAEYATLYMKDMYRRAVRAANGKPVIISETGWPNRGTAFGAAQPSVGNALRYFLDTYRWADEDGVDIFYFSSFDEDWKTGDEGDVGAYWGLWDKHGQLKYG